MAVWAEFIRIRAQAVFYLWKYNIAGKSRGLVNKPKETFSNMKPMKAMLPSPTLQLLPLRMRLVNIIRVTYR